jgi:translation elongation factor EF-Tu-like GTPase
MLDIAVDSVFHMKEQGTVLAGRVVAGKIAVGDTIELRSPTQKVRSIVAGLEVHRKFVAAAETGTEVAVLVREFAPASLNDGLTPDESGGWRVVNLRIHGVTPPWWRFW